MNEMPVLKQLFICEKLIFEQGTDNLTLVNCHTSCRAEQFPTPPIPFIVYGLLTDGYGTFTMQLRVHRLDTFEEIFRKSMPMLLTDRLRNAHFVYRMTDLSFPIAGRYQIDLLINGDLLGMTTLAVKAR
jgi:hypothetical protein